MVFFHHIKQHVAGLKISHVVVRCHNFMRLVDVMLAIIL